MCGFRTNAWGQNLYRDFALGRVHRHAAPIAIACLGVDILNQRFATSRIDEFLRQLLCCLGDLVDILVSLLKLCVVGQVKVSGDLQPIDSRHCHESKMSSSPVTNHGQRHHDKNGDNRVPVIESKFQ